jgi:hypothetical protein
VPYLLRPQHDLDHPRKRHARKTELEMRKSDKKGIRKEGEDGGRRVRGLGNLKKRK